MLHFALRFRRTTDDVVQTVSFDAATIEDAMNLLPRHQGIERGQLWCEGEFLCDLAKAHTETGVLWVVSSNEKHVGD